MKFFCAVMLVFSLLAGCQTSDEKVSVNSEEDQEETKEKTAGGIEALRDSEESASGDGMVETKEKDDDHEPIDIILTGDVMFEWSLEETITAHGPHYPFEHVKKDIKKADYAVANLETAVTDHDVAYKKIYNFKTEPENLDGLIDAGFDFVSLANNHTMDYKEEGLLDTIDALDASSLDYAGAGENKEEAFAPHTVELNGETIKLLAFSQVLPSIDWYAREGQPGIASGYQEERVLNTIEEVEKGADYVLVYMHWGDENGYVPEEAARNYAEKMVDAGADAIVGAHPHVLQGFEFFDKKPVAYSLGNFLFPDYVEGANARTGLLNLTLDNGDVSMSFEPWFIENDQIVERGEEYHVKMLRHLEDHSYGITMKEHSIKSVK
ncbi:CapA family protein [Salibacterium salarium]|uniref:CapA family protein n=1 Tax=Salibacterium salarium TaxID=284579 RepID=A0A428N1M5_9BACI|nr:CapA family protein [Salibacterium salarium]RSL32320.1 CapA family protein [Salibacterium salarium]